jgi:hypothetical protein
MTDPSPSKPSISASPSDYVPPTPRRCFTGALISGPMAYGLYLLTHSIADSFANKPLPNGRIATNIAIAVRTLVVGMSTLATAIFAIATLGLIALGIQLLFQKPSTEGEK